MKYADFTANYAPGLTRPEPGQAFYGVSVTESGIDFEYFPITGGTVARPHDPPAGWIFYDTDTSGFVGWNGSTWVGLGGVDLSEISDGELLYNDDGLVGGVAASTLTVSAAATATTSNGLNFSTPLTLGTVPADGAVVTRSGTTLTGTAISALAVSKIKEGGGTDLTLATVADGELLYRTGTTVDGIAQSALAVSKIKEGGGTDLTLATVADGELLYRTGTTVDGVAASTLTVSSAATATTSNGLNFSTPLTLGTVPADGAVVTRSGTTLTGTAISALAVSKIKEGGGTDLTLATVADGELLYRTGTTVDGIAQSTLAVSKIKEGGGTDLTLATVADGELLYRTGTTVDGVAQTALAGVASAVGLKFGSTTQTLSSTAPTSGQRLGYDGSNIVGVAVPPDGTVAGTTTSSTTTITFATNRRILWNGSGACSLTFDSTGAVDGAEVSIFFPASQITSLAVDTSLSPTAAYSVANFAAASPYCLVMRYMAFPSGHETVLTTGFVVADL